MSGGSFDYLSFKMDSGESDKFVEYADQILAVFDEVAGKLERGEPIVWNGAERVPHPNPSVALIAIHSAHAKIRRARDFTREVQEMMRRLAPFAYAAEWYQSGDWGAENVVTKCVDIMNEALGITEKP